jgi:hypothetical protein
MGDLHQGGLVIWSWFGDGQGITVRGIMVITGFGVCICLQGINSSVNNGLFTDHRDVNPA